MKPERFGRLLAVLALLVGLIAGCERSAQAVDPALVAFLSKARAAHHRADLAEQQGELSTAVASVAGIVGGPRPEPTPEVVEVVAEAYARLAGLRSRQGAFAEALADVDEGLLLATETTHFRGHLFEVRGLVEERRARALAEAGDEAGGGAPPEGAARAPPPGPRDPGPGQPRGARRRVASSFCPSDRRGAPATTGDGNAHPAGARPPCLPGSAPWPTIVAPGATGVLALRPSPHRIDR